MNIYNESVDYNKKYIKYKIKYLEAKNKNIVGGHYYDNKIYNNISGGYDVNNIIIIFINNINNYIINKNNTTIDKLNSKTSELNEIDNYSYPILLGIIQFLLCVICHLMTFNTSIIDVVIKLSDLIANYFESQDINQFINDFYRTIPCNRQFAEIFKQLFESLSNHLKSKIKDFVIKLRENNDKFLNKIKERGLKIIYTGMQIKNSCTTSAINNAKKYLQLSMQFNYEKIFGNYNGGGLILETINYNGCSGFNITTKDIYKLYDTIKNFTIEQLKDVVIEDIDNNIIKILYISKYLIKFIFRMIFVVVPNIKIQQILDVIDSILSLIITIYILSLDIINEYIIDFFEQILPKNNLNKLIMELVKSTIVDQSCKFN